MFFEFVGTFKCCVSFICICVCESFKSESMLCSCKMSVSLIYRECVYVCVYKCYGDAVVRTEYARGSCCYWGGYS